jgi:membrane-associated phospholipid phosphatase
VLPVALAAALLFAWSRWWRGLMAWLLTVGGVLGTILVLKIVFAACSRVLVTTGVNSPSGHTASACIVYGGLTLLLLRGRVPTLLLILLPAFIAAMFGASRLVLHAHTPGDVGVATAVGMTGILALDLLAGPTAPRHKGAMIVIPLLIMAAFHGRHLEAEDRIRDFALAPWLPTPAVCRTSAHIMAVW